MNTDYLADAMAVSRRKLEMRFKKALGRTPHAEIVRRRISHARKLLAESDLSIERVALYCGFGHLGRMYASFKKATGLTPGKYRRQHRQR